MTIEIKVPTFPESIPDGTIATWYKHTGENVERDELIVDVETDKVVLEIVAPADGEISQIIKQEGDTVLSEEVIAIFSEGVSPAPAIRAEPAKIADSAVSIRSAGPVEAPAAVAAAAPRTAAPASPAARKLADEHGIEVALISGTGRNGRITKEDVSRAVEIREEVPQEARAEARKDTLEIPPPAPASLALARTAPPIAESPAGERVERRVPMTRLRASVARRLVEAQHNAAMLTTFNEVNMERVMDLRRKYRDLFEQTHAGTRLGFMSFFVRAAVEALKRFPAVNASIDENDVVYHGYYDIGVAVSTERGLVVPVIRDADGLSLAQIEDQTREFSVKARDNKLTLDEMSGGTFTISNGGVFGSLLSTPILNPPQTAILGMHKIEQRAVVEEGEIVARSMMYLALSYDHRLIDGSEAVRFLVTIKELLEDPARILLEI